MNVLLREETFTCDTKDDEGVITLELIIVDILLNLSFKVFKSKSRLIQTI